MVTHAPGTGALDGSTTLMLIGTGYCVCWAQAMGTSVTRAKRVDTATINRRSIENFRDPYRPNIVPRPCARPNRLSRMRWIVKARRAKVISPARERWVAPDYYADSLRDGRVLCRACGIQSSM